MPESYNKDAYKTLYQRSEWKQLTREYERGFAANLSTVPVVKDAARSALVRLSSMLNAYYGMQDRQEEFQRKNGGRMNSKARLKALEQVAATVAGTTPTVTSNLEKAMPGNSGQGAAGTMGSLAMMGDDQQRMNDTINGNGSLEDQMSLLYSGVMNTDESAAGAQGRTLQNMLRNMNSKGSREMKKVGQISQNEDLKRAASTMDYKGFERLEKKTGGTSGSEIFERAALERGERKAQKERGEGRLSRAFTALKQKLRKDQPGEGAAGSQAVREEAREEPASARGLLQSEGASATTLKLLGAYRMLGAGKRDLLYFRLALIAWMVKGGQNSVYDVLKASHNAGLKGNEDLSEAARMYTTLDPLTEPQLREIAPGRLFPHETMYMRMFNEVSMMRKPYWFPGTNTGLQEGLSFAANMPDLVYMENAFNYDVRDLALNLYTSDAYKVMNAGAREKSEDFMEASRVLLTDPKVYRGSGNQLELSDWQLMDAIFDVLRVSSRMTQDTLALRGAQESDQGQEIREILYQAQTPSGNPEQGTSARGMAAYRGVTYRGGAVWPDLRRKRGSTFVTNSLISTSMDSRIAAKFYGMSNESVKAIVRYKLDGKGAVKIADKSVYKNEAEVLVPIGTTFRITRSLAPGYYHRDRQLAKYADELKEPDKLDAESNAESGVRKPNVAKGWVKINLVEVQEVAGPGEQQRKRLEGGQRKNEKKAKELERYRLRLNNRQAGMGN